MRAIVTGAGGFIGSHLVKYLKQKDYEVIGIDLKEPEFGKTWADKFLVHDLREKNPLLTISYFDTDEFYHLAADMGGIGYIETHKADIVWNNTMINMNVLKSCQQAKVKKFLFTSSACVYPGYLQNDSVATKLSEKMAYPADAEDGYGWEKLMMERACKHFMDDYGLPVYIARFHNIYGPFGTYDGGREKSPAALCRKIAQNDETLEIWGDGTQTRSYCYIDDCVEALYRLMQSDYHGPMNIGTDELVSIDELATIIMKIAEKKLKRIYDPTKPKGVMGRNADLTLAKNILSWEPKVTLEKGLEETYRWIKEQLYSGKK